MGLNIANMLIKVSIYFYQIITHQQCLVKPPGNTRNYVERSCLTNVDISLLILRVRVRPPNFCLAMVPNKTKMRKVF